VEICNYLDLQNCVVYNWKDYGTHTGKSQCTRSNIVGNYYKSGSDNDNDYPININDRSNARVYAINNFWAGHPQPLSDNWEYMIVAHDWAKVKRPFGFISVTSINPQSSYDQVLAEAGANLPQRDTVDSRVIADVRNGAGRIINSQSQVGGWPHLDSGTPLADSDQDGMPDEWETKYGLNPRKSNDNIIDTDNDGYLNIEEYTNGTAPGQPVPTSTPPDYRSYLISWGTSTSGQDENLDGFVNGLDFGKVLN